LETFFSFLFFVVRRSRFEGPRGRVPFRDTVQGYGGVVYRTIYITFLTFSEYRPSERQSERERESRSLLRRHVRTLARAPDNSARPSLRSRTYVYAYTRLVALLYKERGEKKHTHTRTSLLNAFAGQIYVCSSVRACIHC